MAVTILSPHPSDAVLSCWHVLAADPDVRVVNVFAGEPSPGSDLGRWDRLTGARDAGQRHRERLEEDRRALALADVEPVNVDLPAAEYRHHDPEAATLTHVLREHCTGTIYAPAALGGHRDHRLVRDAALALHNDENREVHLYAELPWAIAFGWPGWVTGLADERFLRVESHWEAVFSAAGLQLTALAADVRPLDGVERAKSAALSAYRTQHAALERMFPPDGLMYEMSWSIP